MAKPKKNKKVKKDKSAPASGQNDAAGQAKRNEDNEA